MLVSLARRVPESSPHICSVLSSWKAESRRKVLNTILVANNHGNLCYHRGRLFIAVNLGEFNDPQGNTDSWVYVYDAKTLKFLSRHATQEVFHGFGGIGVINDRFYVMGDLPGGVQENYGYQPVENRRRGDFQPRQARSKAPRTI